ncbi:MAG: pitrilysin family protein [Sedimenticola sp.]
MRRVLIVALLLASCSLLAEGVVHESYLDNGFKIIVKEDHRAPIVATQVWYKVGSSYEPNGVTGVSHLLEHMMFKGTHAYGPGEFSRIIAANGGDDNAMTSRDFTAYVQTLASDRLEVALELEADRMRNLTLPPDEFTKELEVVKEERRLRTEDKPTALTYEQFNALAYSTLPYANPVVGWMNDLNNMEVSDLGDWYRRWYAPNNATLVVVGDVDPEQVNQLAERYFGVLKPGVIPRLKPLREPPQRGEVRALVRVQARQPYLIMGYKAPVITTAEASWEPYALDMLAAVLDGGDSSRFSRNLIRGREVAVSAGAGYNAFSRLSGLFTLSGRPANGHSMEALEKALKDEIGQVQRDLVSEEELQRVRAQVIAGEVYELDSVYYQAMQIGILETAGLDWRLLDQYADNIRQVTAEQVREVARRYLKDERLTVTRLEPLPMNDLSMKRTQSDAPSAKESDHG